MTQHDDIARYLGNLQHEIDAGTIYRTLAETEKQPQLAELYRRLSETEAQHAGFWEEKLRTAGQTPAPRRPSWRTRVLTWLAKRLGPQFVLPTMIAQERTDRSNYDVQADAREAAFPEIERSHARLLETISDSPGSGMGGGLLARLEGRHRAVGGNALRAGVLGANDGLCSNLSLVMGVAGAVAAGQLSPHAILVTGLAGLLAGASSMALGEWLSMQSSRELFQRQIAVEAAEIAEAPQEEEEELALIYQAKGLSQEDARKLAGRLMSDHENALDTLSREELGIDPNELGGSAWEAAITSFCLFAAGAIIPVFPFLFLSGTAAVGTSLAASALTLFLIGAAITLLTGRSVWYSGTRQLLIGLTAAALVYGVGRLLGVTLSG
jgi:VIT1/CCC1 family predicted Fe2+/Mn2+ transporter